MCVRGSIGTRKCVPELEVAFFQNILLSSLGDVKLVPTQCDDYFELLNELFCREEFSLEDLRKHEKSLRSLIVSHPRVEINHEERDLVGVL